MLSTGVHSQVEQVQTVAKVRTPVALVKVYCKASGYSLTSCACTGCNRPKEKRWVIVSYFP